MTVNREEGLLIKRATNGGRKEKPIILTAIVSYYDNYAQGIEDNGEGY